MSSEAIVIKDKLRVMMYYELMYTSIVFSQLTLQTVQTIGMS